MTEEERIQRQLEYTQTAMVAIAQALKLARDAVEAHLHEGNAMVVAGTVVRATRLVVLADAIHAEVHAQQDAIREASKAVYGTPPADPRVN
jgi:hypothetical protein